MTCKVLLSFSVPSAKAAAKLSAKTHFNWFKATGSLNLIRWSCSFSDMGDRAYLLKFHQFFLLSRWYLLILHLCDYGRQEDHQKSMFATYLRKESSWKRLKSDKSPEWAQAAAVTYRISVKQCNNSCIE